MAIKNEIVRKIFDDLDLYRDWCRHEGKVYDEAALYNRTDSNWQQYERYISYMSSKDRSKSKRVN